MGFFSPWFLAGLAALGLPLWLHLLRQFKRTPRRFSSLMFFERRIQTSTKHRRLRYKTLLALRLLLLILLVLAFANPFIDRKADALKRRTLTVIAVDRSFSMRAQKRMEEAKAEAHRVVEGLHGKDLAQVVAFDAHVEALTQPITDKGALHAAINSLTAEDGASSYGEVSRALRVMDESSGMQLAAHIVTDAQLNSMPSSFVDLQVGTHTSETLHRIGRPTANWAIESVSVPAHIYGAATVRVSATVISSGAGDAKKKVSVYVNGRLVAAKDVAVPSCGRGTVEFDDVPAAFGPNRGEVRLQQHDDLPADDSFAFSVERSDPRKALFFYSSGRAAESFYYRSALDASGATGVRAQLAPIEQVSDRELVNCAFVVLHDPGALTEQARQAISEYVTKGGALLIAVGPRTTRAGTLPVSGDEIAATSVVQGVGTSNVQSPELANVGRLQNVQFVSTPRISVRPEDRVLARFADSSPLLIEQRLGEGRILVFASTLDNTTSDFPLHASFLPFVAQTAAYLSGAIDTGSSVVVGTPIVLRQSKTETTAADVVGPSGRHELPLADATHAATFIPSKEGFYDVQRADGRRMVMAVHADRRESDLTPIPSETLDLWRNTGTRADVAASRTEGGTAPWRFWRYVLLLALIAGTVESFFAGRYLKEERQTS